MEALQLCERCEHSCIDGIGLGEFTETFGEITGLPRIDANNFKSCGGESDEEFAFETSGGFEDDLLGFDLLEKFDEFLNSFERIGNGALLLRRQNMNDEFVFCVVDTDEMGFVACPLNVVVLRGGCHGKKLLPC